MRELVLLYNSRIILFLGNIKSRWSGPFTITSVTSFGVVTLKTESINELNVNGQKMKHYIR